MQFDVAGAIKAGATPDQIAQFLAEKQGFDLDGALGAGASVDQVIGFLAKPAKEPESRHIGAVLNDTVISIANAAAGGVAAAGDAISPGNRFSKFIDENIVKAGEASQSDAVKAGREKFQREVAASDGLGDEAAAVGRYLADSPLQAAGQAFGSFAGPGLAIKGARGVAGLLGLGARGTVAAGTAAGVATGAAMGGGDAGGEAYDLVMATPDDVLLQNDAVRAEVAKGRSLDEVKEEAAVSAARKASVLPAIAGGVSGAFGVERFLSGGKGFSGGLISRAVKSGLSEAVPEGLEEGLAAYTGQAAASAYDPSIDPMKGVGASATLGAALGLGPGMAAGVLDGVQSRRRAVAEQALQQATDAASAAAAANEMASVDLDAAVNEVEQAVSAYLRPDGGIPTPDQAMAPQTIETPQPLTPQEKQELARQQLQSTPVADPLAELRLQVNPATTMADVAQRRDAVETSAIERMLAEDMAKAEAQAQQRAQVEQVSAAETTENQLVGLEQKTRERMVNQLMEAAAEPSGYFASRMIPAIDQQLAVLKQPPLTPQERERVVGLTGAAQAFTQPTLPEAPAPAIPDRGADNTSLEARIPEKIPRPSRILGQPTSSYTDDQLTRMIDQPDIPAVSRRGASIELSARQAAQPQAAQQAATLTNEGTMPQAAPVLEQPQAQPARVLEQPQPQPAPVLEQPAMPAIQPQDFEQNQPLAQQTPAVAATENVAPEQSGDALERKTDEVMEKVVAPGMLNLTRDQVRALIQEKGVAAADKTIADYQASKAKQAEEIRKYSEAKEKADGARKTQAEAANDKPELAPRSLNNRWISVIGEWDVLGEDEAKNHPGFASEKSARIAISKNPEWKRRGATILPFDYNDGSYGMAYSETRTRYVVVARKSEVAPEANQPSAQQVPAVAATETVAPTAPVQLGRDQTPLAEGGKPFKTRAQAAEAKKLQPMMRVVSVKGGYALAEKTAAQIAAQEKAAQRLRQARTSPKGEPIPAHAFIAANGGMQYTTKSDMGVDGNPRIGNRSLFAAAGRGLSIERATEMLVAEGYLSQGASHNDAYALIKKSLTQPQYNADGIERIAEMESAAQFEDYLAAQEEMERDPWEDVPAVLDEYTADELEASGYDAAPDAIKAEVQALLEMADARGIDGETILLQAHEQTRNATERDYYETAKSALEEAIQGSPGDRSAPAGRQGEEGTSEGLTAPTREDVLASQDRASNERTLQAREQIRRESEAGAGLFELTREDGRQDTTGALFSRERGTEAPRGSKLATPSDGRIVNTDATTAGKAPVPGSKHTLQDGDTTHSFTVVDASKLGVQGRLIQQVARIFGKRVVAFQSDTLQADGFVLNDDQTSIYLNVESTVSPMAVFGHELTHQMKRDNPQAYAALEAVVQRNVDEEGMAKFREEYGDEANIEELSSDLVGDRFREPAFWEDVFNEVAAQNPTGAAAIVQRVDQAIRKAVDTLLKTIRQQGFNADAYVTNLEEIRDAVRVAMVDYAKQQREPAMAGVKDAPATEGEGATFSGSRKVGPEAKPNTAKITRRRNYGDLTAAQEEALRNVGGIKPDQTMKERFEQLRSKFDGAAAGMADQFAELEALDKDAYMEARLSKGTDGTLEALMLYGKPFITKDGAVDVDIGDEGFAKVLGRLEGEQDRFLWWVAAQRAERLKAQGLERLFSDQDITALKELNRGNLPSGAPRGQAYARALQEMNDFNDAVLKVAEQSGLIDPASRTLFKDSPYVPFYRVMEEEGGVSGPSFSSGLTNQYAWKKLKGGKQKLNEDLLSNVLMNWSHLYAAAAKNRAATAALKAGVRAGIAERVPSGTKGSIRVRDAGKEVHYLVSDEGVMAAISAIEYKTPRLFRILGTFKRMLSIGVTTSPHYKVKNLVRDSVQAPAISDLSYNIASNVIAGFKSTSKDSQTFASMLAGGGLIRFGAMLDGNNADRTRKMVAKEGGYLLDREGWKKVSGMVEDTWDAYNELGDRLENANRAALYEQLLKKGYSQKEANFMARDLMDFTMQGRWGAVRFLTEVVPFMNARIQGLYKLGKAAKADPQKFGYVVGAVALASIALLTAYEDDEDWKKRPDWDRDTNWWFKIGGVAFRIPKPFEVGAIGTLAERGWELAFNKEMDVRRFGKSLSNMIFDTFAMDPTPQIVKPLIDIYANRAGFTNGPIESMAMQRLRPEDRYNERTSYAARFLGQIGLPSPMSFSRGQYESMSPMQIDYLVRGYFGWLGTAVTTTTDIAMRPMMGGGERPDMRLRDMFFVGNFVETLPSGSSRYLEQVYEQSKEIEQAYNSHRAAIKRGDREEAAKIFEEEKDKIRAYKRMNQFTDRISDINGKIKRVESSQTLSGESKRKMIDQLNEQRNKVAERASKAVKID